MRFVASLLLLSVCAVAKPPAKIVLVAGTPSHPPGQHEFNAGSLLLEKWLKQNKGVEPVMIKGGWPQDESIFEGAATIVFYMDGGDRHPMIQMDRLEKLQKLMAKGVGMVCIHYAVEVPKERGGKELLDWIGGYYERPYSQNPHNDTEVTQATPGHAISRGWKSFSGNDEWYYKIRFRPDDKRVTPILTTMLPKDNPNPETIAWIVERADGGRGFGFTGAHFHKNWAMADFRTMVLNAILWTAKMPVPNNGAKSSVTAEEMAANQDPKPAK